MTLECLPEPLVVGLNHKVASLDLRERLAFSPDSIAQALAELKAGLGQVDPAPEAALISTCNRTEIYACAQDPDQAVPVIRGFLAQHAGLSAVALDRLLVVRRGRNAAHHLLLVAAGLDSLVLGENEILGQVRQAGETALSAKASGPVLAALFRAAIQAGKRVRSETEIGAAALSTGQVVAELAEETFGCLRDRTALLIGAGKISSITAHALVRAGLNCVLVTNRTYERAQRMAENLGATKARAVRFDQLLSHLPAADIVICSTGAPHIVLHFAAVHQVMKQRPDRPLLVVDLAVPRDADPGIAELPGVTLVDIDGLEGLVRERHPMAEQTRRQAEAIIDEELSYFSDWYVARSCAPLIRMLQEQANQVCQQQVELTLRRMGDLTPEQEQAVRKMAGAIAGKLLHPTMEALKRPPEGWTAEQFQALVARLYHLDR